MSDNNGFIIDAKSCVGGGGMKAKIDNALNAINGKKQDTIDKVIHNERIGTLFVKHASGISDFNGGNGNTNTNESCSTVNPTSNFIQNSIDFNYPERNRIKANKTTKTAKTTKETSQTSAITKTSKRSEQLQNFQQNFLSNDASLNPCTGDTRVFLIQSKLPKLQEMNHVN